jgi:hypothetical protein
LGKALAAVVVLGLSVAVREAGAAATVHRFNLVLSMIPTQVDGGDFNTTIDFINRTRLAPFGLEGMKRITFAWLFDAQLEYFVRPNMAISAGVGQIRAGSNREFLPTLNAAVQLHGEVLSVPVQVGGTYFLAPYNQGDFQARAYFGAGVMSMVYNKAVFQQEATGLQGVPSALLVGTQDAPGYYAEAGGRMFFASRLSIMLGAIYRSARVANIVDQETRRPLLAPDGSSYTLDLSGVGVKLGVGIGF